MAYDQDPNDDSNLPHYDKIADQLSLVIPKTKGTYIFCSNVNVHGSIVDGVLAYDLEKSLKRLYTLERDGPYVPIELYIMRQAWDHYPPSLTTNYTLLATACIFRWSKS